MSDSEGDGGAGLVRSSGAGRDRRAAQRKARKPDASGGRKVGARRERRRREPGLGSRRMDLALALGLWTLAFLHRMLFLFSNVDRSWGFTVFYEGDSETFYDFARAILAGVPYDGGIPFHPPFWPYVLSSIHMLVGAGDVSAEVPHLQVKLWTAAIGSLVVPLLFLVSRRYLGRGIGLLSALVAVYSFGLYTVSIAPVSESLYMALLLSSLLILGTMPHPLAPREPAPMVGSGSMPAHTAAGAAGRNVQRTKGRAASLRADSNRTLGADSNRARRADSNRTLGADSNRARRAIRADSNRAGPRPEAALLRWGRPVGLGALLGLLCLTRAEAVLFALAIVVLGLLGAGFRARRGMGTGSHESARWIVCLATALLVLLPWTVRNHQALEQVNTRLGARMAEPLPTFVPITAYGPLNFALANNDLAEGPFSRAILTSQAESATIEVTDPQHLEYFLHGYRIGLDWIRESPGEFVRLVLRKWELFFGAGTLGFTQWNLPGGLDGIRRPVDLFVPNSNVGAWILFPLALLGTGLLLVGGGAGRRWALLALLLTGAGMVASGLFFGYARLGVIVFPFWLSLAVSGVVALMRNLPLPKSSASRSVTDGGRLRRQEPEDAPEGPEHDASPNRSGSSPSDRVATALAWTPSFRSTRERMAWLLPVVLLLGLEVWGATGDRNFRATGTQAEGESHLNPHDTMHLEVIPRD